MATSLKIQEPEADTQRAAFPANFTMTAKGLIFHVGDDMSLITGPFDVVAQTRDRFSQAWGVLLRWFDDDGELHQLAIARSQLAGDGREVRQALLHGGLYVSPFAKDRNALQTFLASVKIARRARAVTRVGWQDGSFALPDRTIELGSGDLVVYQGTAALDHEFRSAGALNGWQERVARLGVGNSRLAIALCAGFVGPLLEATGSEGGGLHLRGASSIGKSTALLAAASIWGSPSFVRQWRTTANGLEGIAEQSNDCLLILDELAQLDPREAGSVAYLLANGSGKSRASQTGEARTAKRWLTFFLSSGEISLAEHARSDGRGKRSPAGQEVRILDVEADAGQGFGLFDTLHGQTNGDSLARVIKEGAAEHYGIAGPEFVRRLLGNLDNEATTIRIGIDRFTESNLPAGATGQVARACRRLGLIAMAGESAIHLGILPWEPGEAVAAAGKIFSGWIEARGGAGAAEDQAAIEQVAEFISTHGNSRFQPMDGNDSTVIHNRAGFKRETGLGTTEYLIPAATWRNEVCRGLNPKTVAAMLIAKGHMIPDASGKASRVENAPGMGKARFYVVGQSIFGGEDA
jgi:putative DNA primase/helicase